MRNVIRWVAAVWCALASSSAGHAERRLALAVGIDVYDNLAALEQLQKAVNDARAMGAALRELGFETTVEENLPRLAFTRAWQKFLNRLEPGDTAALFFAGHGVEINGLNYLLPRDVPKVVLGEDRVLAESSIRFNGLMDDVRERNVRVSLFIVDACRDNPFRDGTGRSVGGTRGLRRVEPAKGSFVMYSAAAGEEALDRLPGGADTNPNSVYTRTLLPILGTPGLSLQDVALRVREQVVEVARRAGREQTPAYYDQLVGRLVLRAGPISAPQPQLSEAALEWSRVDKSSIVELETFERRHATSPEAEYARARLRELRKLALAVPPAPPIGPPTPAPAQRKRYDEGASDTEIRIGNTNPYSGPVSSYGTVGKTIGAYFSMINDTGGINGRKINFISYDDGYSPPKALGLVRKLVDEDKVLLVFQSLGTPNNLAISPYLNERKVPQLFVASGASTLGDPTSRPWTMGFQPDYATEGNIYAKHILATVRDPRIAVLMQNDDYGKDHLRGFKAGLGGDAHKIVQVATYEVIDATIDSQMTALKNSGANVFFNITTPKWAAQAIRRSAELGWRPVHYINSVSASVGTVMKSAGLENAQGIVTAVYLKDPTDPQYAGDRDFLAWKAFMQRYYPGGDLTHSLNAYAYAVANLMAVVLKQAGDDLTRANVMKQAASLKGIQVPMVIEGITVNTGPADFYPIQSMRLARLKGESWEVFGGIMSAEAR